MTQPDLTEATAAASTTTAQQVAAAWYARQQALARKTAQAVQGWWARMSLSNLDASWSEIGQTMTATVGAGQLFAASGADGYVDQVLAAQGVSGALGATDGRALAGVASDGRPLGSLLYQAVIGVKEDIGTGMPPDTAMLRGRAAVVRMATTQVQDAGRVAVGVATAQRAEVDTYVRMLTPPSCSRCVLLAGLVTHWATAFERHPLCDCVNVPVGHLDAVADIRINPRTYFDSLSKADQDSVFTAAGAQAIRDGADIYQVVNARRGMSSTIIGRGSGAEKVLTTTEGTTRRGVAGKRLGSARIPRLMPEQIYKDANGNRDVAIALLQRFGYIR